MQSTVPSAPAAGPPPVPDTGQNPFGGEQNAGFAPPDAANPFASPASAATGPAGHGTGEWPNQKMEATYAVSTAWMIFKENLGVILGGFVLITVIGQAISFLQQGVQMLVLGGNGGGGDPPIMLFAIMAIFFVISTAVQTFLWVGFVRILLACARGQNPEFGVLFSGGQWFLRGLGGTILFNLMVGIGMVALIVPGVYLALRYWPYLHFIVDQDCSVGNAFSRAGEATKNNMGEGFLLGLIGFGLAILGLIMFCVGILFTAPLVHLAWTVSYLMITAQPFKQQQRIV